MKAPVTSDSGYLPSDALVRAGRNLAIAALSIAAGWLFFTALYLTVYAQQEPATGVVISEQPTALLEPVA